MHIYDTEHAHAIFVNNIMRFRVISYIIGFFPFLYEYSRVFSLRII